MNFGDSKALLVYVGIAEALPVGNLPQWSAALAAALRVGQCDIRRVEVTSSICWKALPASSSGLSDIVHNYGDRQRRVYDEPPAGRDLAQPLEHLWVAHNDEMLRLTVPRALGPATCAKDPAYHGIGNDKVRLEASHHHTRPNALVAFHQSYLLRPDDSDQRECSYPVHTVSIRSLRTNGLVGCPGAHGWVAVECGFPLLIRTTMKPT